VALKRAVRLRNSGDFQRVRQQGRSVSSRLLILVWSPNDSGRTRIGFVVSKRIAKQAVERNRLKRLLGEAVRGYLPDILPGMDIVISARNATGAAPLSTLSNEIRILLQRAKLLAIARSTTNQIP
jgi:ribonuclease P protein component